MTQHFLQGRSEKEVLWFQRRDTLKAAAAWVAMGSFGAAVAQQRTFDVGSIANAPGAGGFSHRIKMIVGRRIEIRSHHHGIFDGDILPDMRPHTDH